MVAAYNIYVNGVLEGTEDFHILEHCDKEKVVRQRRAISISDTDKIQVLYSHVFNRMRNKNKIV